MTTSHQTLNTSTKLANTNPTSSKTSNERPDRYACKAIWTSIIGYALDGFDLLILGFALPVITTEFHLTANQAGFLATITLLGAVVGGLIGGILSDRFGRVRVLSGSVLLFAVFTAATGLAPDYTQLIIYRFIAGIGLGSEFGIGMTLAAESWPARLRARATSLVALGWQTSVLMAAILSAWLIPVIGWRGLFILGAAPALFAFIVRRKVEEPQHFIKASTQHSSAPSLKLLIRDKTTTKATIGLLILTSVQNFGYYGLMIWLPSYLANQYGFSLTKSALWTATTVLGMAFGIIVFGWLADRYGRRPALLGFQAGAILSVFTYAHLISPEALLIGGAIMGIFVNGMLGGYGALMAELYPTKARATAQNVLFNLGRGIGGFAPLIVGTITARYSFTAAITLLAACYLLDIYATLFLIPERRGIELE